MATFSDSFTRANGTLNTGNWEQAGTSETDNWKITSNQAGTNSTSNATSRVTTAAATFTGNHSAQVTQNSLGSAGGRAYGVAVRVQGPASAATCYWAGPNGGGSWNITKYVAGTDTAVGTPVSMGTVPEPGSAYTLYLEANGSTLTFKINGSTVVTATDSSITGGQPGLHAFDNPTGFTTYSAADLAGGASAKLLSMINNQAGF